jgi:hypothetical protein
MNELQTIALNSLKMDLDSVKPILDEQVSAYFKMCREAAKKGETHLVEWCSPRLDKVSSAQLKNRRDYIKTELAKKGIASDYTPVYSYNGNLCRYDLLMQWA